MNAFIFNPEARRAKLKNKIVNYLIHLGVEGEVIEVKDKDLVGKGVAEAIEKGADTIIAIGGDGVVNRVVQKLAKTDIVMGIIPIGETNFFANMLGISDWKKGCESIINKKIVNLNLGIIANEKYFTSSIEIEGKGGGKNSFLQRLFRKNNGKYYPVTIHVEDDHSKFKMQTNMSSILITTVSLPIPKDFNIISESEDQKLNIIIKSKPNQQKSTQDVVSTIRDKKLKLNPKAEFLLRLTANILAKPALK